MQGRMLEKRNAESRKETTVAVIGGGFAGVMTALACHRRNPGATIVIYERGSNVLEWMERLGRKRLVLGWALDDREAFCASMHEGTEAFAGVFMKTPGSGARMWWEGLNIPVEVQEAALLSREPARRVAAQLREHLESARIRIFPNHAAEEAAFSADGSVRIWFPGQDVAAAKRLVLAVGGGPNRALSIARDAGHEEEPFGPGCFGLRVSDPRLRGLQGLELPQTSVELSAGESPQVGNGAGTLRISGRGLEGTALLEATAALAKPLADRKFQGRLMINWLGYLAGATVSRTLKDHGRDFGKRRIHEDPLFDLPPKLWARLALAARIPPDLPWISCPGRKLQAFLGQLTHGQFTAKGHFLDTSERTWRGGVKLAGLDPATFQSRKRAGVFMAGELLDYLGAPGAAHTHATLGTALLAGEAAAEET